MTNSPHTPSPHTSSRKTFADAAMIIVGAAIFAVGLDCFEIPHGLAAGGVSGLATVFAALAARVGWQLPVGMQTLAMNGLLMLLVIREGGLRYASRSALGIVASSVFIDLLAPLLPVLGEGDMILCAVWGGVLCGGGLGLVFRAGGNTGGSDIVVQLLVRHTSLTTSAASLICDAVVVGLSVPVFGVETALYAVIAMYVCAKVLDLVVDGLNTHRAAYIISDQHEVIKQRIFAELDRGCTELLARGGYTGKDRPVLFVVLRRTETTGLRRIVAETDPEATVVVAMVHNAFGNGFDLITGQIG